MKLILFISLATFFHFSENKNVKITDSDVILNFYSIYNPIEGIQTNISNKSDVDKTAFSNKKHTVIFIHGWLDTFESSKSQLVKDKLLQKHDINVFLLNWDAIASDFLYPIAFLKVESVGHLLGNLLQEFVNTSGLDLSRTSIIGHSLGAHIGGVAGLVLNGELDYIVGLDPAGPLFTKENTNNRLSTSSAKFVQAIHTCGLRLGYYDQIGHADYYPNSGLTQPMCNLLDMKCSHLISLEYYGESVLNENFKAKKCDSYDDYQNGMCNDKEDSLMGGFKVDKDARGTYYLKTNNEPPYAINNTL